MPKISFFDMKATTLGLGLLAAIPCHAQQPAHGEQDGSSFEKAIVIQEKTESAGIPAEYAWIHTHYPKYKADDQKLLNHEGKPYDMFHLKSENKQDKVLYFDISSFFGKI